MLDVDVNLFKAYVFYSILVILKMMIMSFWTTKARFQNKSFINTEDAAAVNVKVRTDEKVERIRRNHLNDIENILPFVIVAAFYILVASPSYGAAVWHFRIFTVSRLVHTAFYQIPIPQPSRALAFVVGTTVTVSMALQTLMSCRNNF